MPFTFECALLFLTTAQALYAGSIGSTSLGKTSFLQIKHMPQLSHCNKLCAVLIGEGNISARMCSTHLFTRDSFVRNLYWDSQIAKKLPVCFFFLMFSIVSKPI